MMPLEDLFGNSRMVVLLDLLLPLEADMSFGIAHVVKATGLDDKGATRLINNLIKLSVITDQSAVMMPSGAYALNTNSPVTIALKRLFFTVYSEQCKRNSTTLLQGES